MGIKNIKYNLAGFSAGIVLALSSLVALPAMGSADTSVTWTGQGADSVKACDTGQTPYLHWIFTTGGNSSVTAANLTVSGAASGGGAMSEHGGSWSLNTSYSGTGQPTTSSVMASVTFTGSLGNGTANLVISDGCFGTGGQGGGPQVDCDNDTDNSPQSECSTTGPTMDCDGDTDSSPASECATPTGGQGGGTTTTTTAPTGQVLAATTTTGGQVQSQVQAPQGGVGAGFGGASVSTNPAAVFGLGGSLLSLGAGLALFNRRESQL